MNLLFTPEALLGRIYFFIPILISLTVHEWAHARTAYALGDDTAHCLGRMTLNPLDHIDPIGTFILPLMGVPFGWAKPVPFEPTRFRQGVSMRWGTMLVALAGPVSNFAIALLSVLLLLLIPAQALDGAATELLRILFTVNIMLATFNLLPIFPLDGSHIFEGLLPRGFLSGTRTDSFMSIIVLIVGLTILVPLVQAWSQNLLALM